MEEQEQEVAYRGGGRLGKRNAAGQLTRAAPTDIYPGLNDMSDALEAIPMDIVRHFTLLKEIDAKCVGTTPLLGELIVEFLSLPVPSPATLQAALAASSSFGSNEMQGQEPTNPAAAGSATGSGVAPGNAPVNGENDTSNSINNGNNNNNNNGDGNPANNNSNGNNGDNSSNIGNNVQESQTDGASNNTANSGNTSAEPAVTGSNVLTVSEEEIASIVKREELLAQIRRLINELVPCLEEKMHVAGVAADAMARHVARIDYDFDLICNNEIPERIQVGSANHPAFIAETRLANEQQKGNQTSRSESRREAMAAKKAAAAADGLTGSAATGSGGAKGGRNSTPVAGKGSGSAVSSAGSTTAGGAGSAFGSGATSGRGRGAGKNNGSASAGGNVSANGGAAGSGSVSSNYGNGLSHSNTPAPKRRKGAASAGNTTAGQPSALSNNSSNATAYNSYNYEYQQSYAGQPGTNNGPGRPAGSNNGSAAAGNAGQTNQYNEYANGAGNTGTGSYNGQGYNSNSNENSVIDGYEGSKYENEESISRPTTPAGGNGRRGGRQRTRTVGANSNSSSANAKDDGEPVYCYCQQVSFGEMVGCDGPECKREWFHLPCIGLSSPPKGQWFCEDCAAKYKKPAVKR
ncbi:Pho23p [Sugiyamaella lignohabitans]|uniref:Chromatin modification-related protein n=1 Tax=Sugiyamaella lignohabitans TaxID=796027 RepID=A0A167EDG5_9ASCO|nr:Pho23p [Sugiyamaella lignohabitans]ANB13934.1 Pho23p [Sugiyamaella lignohabitans]